MKKVFILLLLCPYLSIAQSQPIKGIIVSASGNVIQGAAITSSSAKVTVISREDGSFEIMTRRLPDTLLITHVSYQPKQFIITTAATISIILDEATNKLDETVVIAYGTTTRRLNTGSVSGINAKEISKQPVSNPLTALSGRLAGVTVTQQSGVPGASVKLQVRGRNSIAQGTDPLFIIDGVPFAAGNQAINQNGSLLTSETGTGLSPFQSLSPSDIESIEVLKDADATAIYGSRGANGVVLITTKKGKAGKAKLTANIYHSTSSLTRTMEMMNTQQYIAMRREAFANDNLTPNNNTAPDLLLWDTTRYTDFKKMLFGHSAPTTNAELSLSGGDVFTQYRIGGSYRNESTVFNKSMNAWRAAANLSLQHTTTGGRLNIIASVHYTNNHSNLTPADAGLFLASPPDLPELYDSTGKLNWQKGGVNFTNPLYYRYQQYTIQTENLSGRLSLSYKPFSFLTLRTALGYNTLRSDETSVFPIAAQNPALAPLGALELGTNYFQSVIFEPQAEYQQAIFGGRLSVLAGATFQSNNNLGTHIKTSGYTSDNLINALAAGPTLEYKSNNQSKYRYNAIFARANYNYANKYLVNLSGRYDGSSRFGPGNQFSAFGAIGAGWIFTNEKLFKQSLPFLSYGKLRGSYGTSGNDQIGDYQYLDAWSAANPYLGNTALSPTNLLNPDYHWELNRKLEAAIELGFLKEKLLLNIAWYRNRTGNQLVNYRLPSQTGFTSVVQNLNAVVQNTGAEIELTSHNIETKNFSWSTALNLTIPRNKLLSFPGLETSSYANTYVMGHSLNTVYRYRYTGVDPATGVFTFDDIDKSGTLSTADYQASMTTDPIFYGGLQNNFSYKGFQLSVFAEFRKQQGRNYLYSLYNTKYVPGLMYNAPVLALDRWQKTGDVATIQRYTVATTSAAYRATSSFLLSDGIYSDASFIRIKTVSLSYDLPASLLKKAGVRSGMLYINAQNLFTITRYKGSDPETQNLWQLPPLKTIAIGISFTL
jgi:TonB-linked SusC/RagA family outer membrane protein